MEPSKEKIAGALVWSFVEHVRERDTAGEPVSFTPSELEELVSLLNTAASIPGAVMECPDLARQNAVRARLEETLAQAPMPTEAAPAAREGRTPRRWQPAPWTTAAAFGLAAALFLAVSTVGMWHHPAPVLLTRRPAAIHPMDESRAHELIPQMVRNELNPQDEKDLMWHLLVCRGCFDRYFQAQHGEASPQAARANLLRLVSR